MHIVYLVLAIDDISGGLRVITEHVNGLAGRGHNVELWVESDNLTPRFECKVRISKYDPARLDTPDVVVMTDPGFIPQAAQHRAGKSTFLLMQHDNDWVAGETHSPSLEHYIDEYKGLFSSGVWGVIAVSSWVKQVYAQKQGIDSALVPNGVDGRLFRPSEPIVNPGQPAVLFCYDSQPWKGLNEAITATLEAKKHHEHLAILAIGRVFPKALESDQQAFFTFPNFYFNRPDQTDLARIYSSATVFVSSSWKEGFGLPGLEAMACGVPVVTTDSGGVREYAIPDETAVVVPPQDPRALAEGILRVLDDKQLRDKLIKNGRGKAAEFSWDKSIDRLEEVLFPKPVVINEPFDERVEALNEKLGGKLFFVEIGAMDGVNYDALHKHVMNNPGWEGVLVEPLGDMFQKLQRNYRGRAGLRFENSAITGTDGETEITRIPSENINRECPEWAEGISTLKPEMHIISQYEYLSPHAVKEPIRTITFASLAQAHGIKKIDLLQIDTEGFDREIFDQIWLAGFRPSLIKLEILYMRHMETMDLQSLLEANGYSCIIHVEDMIATKN